MSRRSTTTPEISPSSVPVVIPSVSAPGTTTSGATVAVVPAGAVSDSIVAAQGPAPPPASASVTALLRVVLAPTSPNETAVGVGRTSGWSAAATSTSPAPARVVGETTPPTETGRAVTLRAAFTWSGVHSGCRWSSSATAPETWGAAMLVPDDVAHPSGSAERIDVPGATKSGLSRSETGVGPEEEKLAMPGAVPDVLAPTVIARVELPGDDNEPGPKSSKSFPAATTGTTPAAAAASSASATTSRDGSISGSPIERLMTSMPSVTAASIAATISGALPSSPTLASVGTVSTL